MRPDALIYLTLIPDSIAMAFGDLILIYCDCKYRK